MEFKGTKGRWFFDEPTNVKAYGVKGLVATAWGLYDSKESEIRQEGESWLDMKDRTQPIRDLKEKESIANAKLIACAPELLEMLDEARLQIEYLQGKFGETGSGNSVLSRITELTKRATE